MSLLHQWLLLVLLDTIVAWTSVYCANHYNLQNLGTWTLLFCVSLSFLLVFLNRKKKPIGTILGFFFLAHIAAFLLFLLIGEFYFYKGPLFSPAFRTCVDAFFASIRDAL